MHLRYLSKDEEYRAVPLTSDGKPDFSPQPVQRYRSRRTQSEASIPAAPYQNRMPRSTYYQSVNDAPAAPRENPYRSRRAPAEEPPAEKPVEQSNMPITGEDGSQFDAPASPQIPEWYRVARLNHSVRDERRSPAPRVQPVTAFEREEPAPKTDALGRPLRTAAPRNPQENSMERFYENAGYPQELIRQQRILTEEQEWNSRKKNHGAMAAAPREQRRNPEMNASMPLRPALEDEERRRREEFMQRYQRRRQEEETQDYPSRRRSGYDLSYAEEEPQEAAPFYKTPQMWLWVGLAALTVLFSSLLILRADYTKKTEQLLLSRAQQEERILQQHPLYYREWIEREAKKNNLHPAFVCAIIFNESTFRPDAESSVGARGLMQLMAPTAQDIAGELEVPDYSFDLLYDAETNITFGCYYLGQLSRRFRGDPVCVSAAYHAGAQQVQNWLNTKRISPDGVTLVLDNMQDGPTKAYAGRVTRDFAIYQRLYFSNWED